MSNPAIAIFVCLLTLPGCSALAPVQPADIKQTQLGCEQQALVAQEQYLARIKTPAYTSSRSTTWAGGARSDNGKWLYDASLKTCMQHAGQHEGGTP